MKSNNRIKFLEYKVVLLGATFCLTVLLFNGSTLAGPELLSGKDKNVILPQEVAPFNWSGFYIGGNVGGNWTYADYGSHLTEIAAGAIEDDSEVPPPDLHDPPSVDDFSLTDEDRATLFSPSVRGNSDVSFLGGGQLGYQRQFGNMVFGLEGDFDGVASNGNETTATSSGVTNIFDEPDSVNSVLTSWHKTEVNWHASVRGRLGYANGRFLFYGTGGAAFADVSTWSRDTVVSHVFDDSQGTPTEEPGGAQIHSTSGRDDGTLVGWTAGAGAEFAVCRLFSIGIEYRHNDFGSRTLHDGSSTQYVSAGNTRLDNLSGDQVTMRINILLGHLGLGK
jgi:outer membrane immunogenic protein